MAELATIARPYAEALFKACKEVAGVDIGAAANWAEKLAAIAADPQMRSLADNPKVTAEQLFGVFASVAGADLPEIAKNAIADACTGSNPRQPSQEEMEKLLKCCYYDTEVDF